MDNERLDASTRRFSAYLDGLASVMGHAARVDPLKDYCSGLLLPLERKSVEPIAAATAPERVSAQHQVLLHFIGEGGWSDEKVSAKVREMVLPKIERNSPIEAWVIDDTGFPKHGRHSVGVARQYCGQLGKQDNCQVAVSLSLANHNSSLPVAYDLYLPKSWAEDDERRTAAGVPDDISFKTKPRIAIDQIEWAVKAGLPRGVVLMDSGYGCDVQLRAKIAALSLKYVAGIRSNILVRKAGKGDVVPVEALARSLPKRSWRMIEWREGTVGTLVSRFARVRVTVGEDAREEWLLIEWPEDEKEPTKYWLSTLSANIDFTEFVDIAKLRWRIERDYLELKQEVGLDHFEGRGWRGFHHHATLCIAAYGFLISEREDFPPSGPRSGNLLRQFAIPAGCRPRGSAAAA